MDAIRNTVRLSLVIPAFNEGGVIAQAICEAHAALQELLAEFEIIIVDDGSTDDTAQVVEQTIPRAPGTRLLRHGLNQGYGAALRSGFLASRHELVAFTDADCQFDLLELGKLVLLSRHYPIVVGCRVARKDPWLRRLLSRGYNRIARTLLGTRVRDVDCALKVFKREALLQLLPESQGFFVNTEMMSRAYRLGLTVAEVPVTHRPRANGSSKVSLWEVPRTLRAVVAFWLHEVVVHRHRRPITPAVFQSRVVVPEVHRSRAEPLPVSSRGLPTALPVRHREAA